MVDWDLKTPATRIALTDELPRPTGWRRSKGGFVAVRKAGDEKTQLGLYIGDLPVTIAARQAPDGVVTIDWGLRNPAIYVIETGEIVYGLESWWGVIKSPEQLREITDADIDNVWYVQALKEIEARSAKDGARAE